MLDKHRSSKILTDHHGWPVAVNRGAIWWMVADVEPAELSRSGGYSPDTPGEPFRLQLTNGQSLIAIRDAEKRRWTVTAPDDSSHDSSGL